MTEPARRKATYEDILAAPPEMVAEIIDGELILSPRPVPRHARTSAKATRWLDDFDEDSGDAMRPSGWWILPEPELHLGSHVVVPDIAGWRRERMPQFPEGPFITLPPDWVCEILSPSTERRDRLAKADIYATAGVAWMWLVHPDHQTLEVYEARDGLFVRIQWFEGAALVRARPFESRELELGRWWVPGAKPL